LIFLEHDALQLETKVPKKPGVIPALPVATTRTNSAREAPTRDYLTCTLEIERAMIRR
jgi:hypothetical protein